MATANFLVPSGTLCWVQENQDKDVIQYRTKEELQFYEAESNWPIIAMLFVRADGWTIYVEWDKVVVRKDLFDDRFKEVPSLPEVQYQQAKASVLPLPPQS